MNNHHPSYIEIQHDIIGGFKLITGEEKCL